MIDILIPVIGESINEVQLAAWLVKEGDYVEKDQEVAEVDSDKATLAVPATHAGKIALVAGEGDTLPIGAVIARIDTDAVAPAGITKDESPEIVAKKPEPEVKPQAAPAKPVVADHPSELKISPLARKLMEDKGLTEDQLMDGLKRMRIGKMEVNEVLASAPQLSVTASTVSSKQVSRDIDRKKMSTLRLKLSERLVGVKNQTAMLTTFNEVDMTAINTIRAAYNEKFKEKHGFSIGFMSFFSKAATLALQEFPQVKAQIDGDELLIPSYVDLGIAVSGPKGLLVPVIRNAELLSLAEMEGAIKTMATKARNNKITLEEMSGGTFTISNGGVFGSMMSTPILNPPQSAILGMHNIIDRPVAIHGKVEIRPMMYLALSYDHRVIDGRESVTFLVRIKELLEHPEQMLLDGKDPVKVLLDLA